MVKLGIAPAIGLLALAAAIVVAGVAMIYLPAAVILGGLALFAAAWEFVDVEGGRGR